jgi:WD40 repeat protein
MSSGLEFLIKGSTSNVEDPKKVESPEDLKEAMESVVRYIESQLPNVIDVDFTPLCFDITEDENKLIMGGQHGNIGTFDLVARKVTKDIELCSTPISSILFGLKDSIVIVANEAKALFILDFPSFNLVHTFTVSCITLMIKPGYGRDSIMISTCTNIVLVYDLKQLEDDEDRSDLNKREINVEGSVTCLDLCDDGSLLAFGFLEGYIRLYHGETESSLQESANFECRIDIISFGQYRKLIAAGLSDSRVIVWNIDSNLSLKHIIECHNGDITGLAFVKENRYLISGSSDTKIIVHDMKVDRSPYQLELFDQKVLWFKPSQDFKKLYYTQNMNKLMIWDVPFLSKNARYRKHTKKVTKVIFIPNSFDLLSIGEDGQAIIWDYRNDVSQEAIDAGHPLTTGIISSTSQFAFLCSTKPSLLRWSLATYKYYDFDLNSIVRSIRFSSDENFLALGDDLYRIIIYDAVIMERKYIIKGHTNVVTEIYFIKGDTEVISASKDHSLVEWNLNTSDKINSFLGHSGPVTCMIVTADELWVISGSEDNTIIIWSLDNINMHILNQQGSTNSLYLSQDKTYLVTLQDTMMNFWQMDNLSRMFQTDMQDGYSLAFSSDEKTIAITEGNTIFVEENPLKSKNIRVVGKNYGSSHKFMNYILEIVRDGHRSTHFDIYNHWLFTPYCMSMAHILAYENRHDTLFPVLLEDANKAPFCSTIKKETPLSISVEMDHKSCIETCLKYLKSEFNRKNKLAYVPLGACLTKLNSLEISSIPRLYETLYQRNLSQHLPRFCMHGTELPSLYHSEDFLIKSSNLIPNDLVSTHGLSIVFYNSLCPIDLENGTNGSIEFLESLINCSFPEIFRTKLLQTILLDKWEKVKWAIYIQGMLYIFYLVQLSLFCIFFRQSSSYLALLFVVHVILFLYEVVQIGTDFFDYWLDVWNILDQLRGLSFTLYCFLDWNGDSNDSILLIVIIFSYTRGISYFRMFDGTRYMVRLLSEVIKDMRVFFIILFYSTLAFTFIFYLRSPGPGFFGDFLTVSYRLNLGDFDADYTETFDWIIFFLASVINPLIMLNLLISIMGDTYGKVQETNDIANFQELTEMIMEIEKLMFWKKGITKQHYMQQCDFLRGNEQEKDKVNERIKALRTQLNSVERTVSHIKNNIRKSKIDHLYSAIQEMAREKEEMQNVILQNQEMMENTRLLLENIYKKLGESEIK